MTCINNYWFEKTIQLHLLYAGGAENVHDFSSEKAAGLTTIFIIAPLQYFPGKTGENGLLHIHLPAR